LKKTLKSFTFNAFFRVYIFSLHNGTGNPFLTSKQHSNYKGTGEKSYFEKQISYLKKLIIEKINWCEKYLKIRYLIKKKKIFRTDPNLLIKTFLYKRIPIIKLPWTT